MALDLADYDQHARKGVKQFWSGRSSALDNDEERSQGGERAGVLGGKNMDGFLALVAELVRRNGLPDAEIHTASRPLLTLPGYFRPTKLWDVLVIDRGALVAAIELKSHVGPSFGNNFNNRTEEAIGTAHDLWTAIRENALGEHGRLKAAAMDEDATPEELGRALRLLADTIDPPRRPEPPQRAPSFARLLRARRARSQDADGAATGEQQMRPRRRQPRARL